MNHHVQQTPEVNRTTRFRVHHHWWGRVWGILILLLVGVAEKIEPLQSATGPCCLNTVDPPSLGRELCKNRESGGCVS